ncbi:hypothetical protein ASG11_15990 [Sphingomonas sp. Leaf357]|uniref:hypothetical protein n=1 Tax=Sphingomonas sp. Leaf357 TaxID=1736350 RepID=UPI0006F59A1A|nr:hypothetical protein [Sphingomonas sp. Leaf357]KQS02263.1 hypothetical protein ASG11_15990 [Sphingomonas sp. Leaf357]
MTTTFGWTDRHGVTHDLSTHDDIERERQEVRQELLDLRATLASADDAVFVAAYDKAAALGERLMALQQDLQCFIRHEAMRATAMIAQIELDAAFLRSLHRSYEQREACGDDPAALAVPPTPDQMSVLRRQAIREGREAIIPSTFGEAHALLFAHSATRRAPLPVRAPGFEWTDRDMHYHQVRDLRQIEREYVALANDLSRLRPQLAADVPIRDAIKALEAGRLAVDRVSILERTMTRWTTHVIAVARSNFMAFLDELEKSDGRDV